MHLLKAFALFASSIHQLLWGRNNEKLFKVNNHLSSHNFKLRFSKNMPNVQKNHFGEKLRESRSPGEANSVFGGKDKVKLYRGFAPDIFRHKTTSLNAYRSAKLFLCRKNIHCKFLPPLLVLKEITRKCFPSFIHTILMVDTRWLLLLAGCCCCWLSIE